MHRQDVWDSLEKEEYTLEDGMLLLQSYFNKSTTIAILKLFKKGGILGKDKTISKKKMYVFNSFIIDVYERPALLYSKKRIQKCLKKYQLDMVSGG